MGRQGRVGGGGRYYSLTLVYATPLLQHLAQSGAYAAVRTLSISCCVHTPVGELQFTSVQLVHCEHALNTCCAYSIAVQKAGVPELGTRVRDSSVCF